MTWFNTAMTRTAVLASCPQFLEPFEALYRTLWQLAEIPATTLELCRLRIAQLHDCPLAWEQSEVALAAGQREALANWHHGEVFNAGEQACLAFTEVYTMDPQAITDEQADAVKAAYGEPGLVALVEALGLFYGLTRLNQLWDLPAESEQ